MLIIRQRRPFYQKTLAQMQPGDMFELDDGTIVGVDNNNCYLDLYDCFRKIPEHRLDEDLKYPLVQGTMTISARRESKHNH